MRKIRRFPPLERKYKIQTDGVRFKICEKRKVIHKRLFGKIIKIETDWFDWKEYCWGTEWLEVLYFNSLNGVEEKIEDIKKEDIKELGEWKDLK